MCLASWRCIATYAQPPRAALETMRPLIKAAISGRLVIPLLSSTLARHVSLALVALNTKSFKTLVLQDGEQGGLEMLLQVKAGL